MIKGIWWHIVVLLLAESVWAATCLNNLHRQKRQIRKAIYLQRLRDARYLPPIPVRIPQYVKEQPERTTRGPFKIEASPWIPMDGIAENIPNRNIYVPPLHSPTRIITRKPLKTSFNVPLTKSIQVSQVQPNIQTVGYIKKEQVKVPETRTAQTPELKTHSTLAESAIHSRLNLTPADDGRRLKHSTTAYPKVVSNKDFNKKIISNSNTNLNYTRIRLGEVSPAIQKMPVNGADFEVLRNKTNFVMKFSPEDIKMSSKNKAKNVDKPFYPSSSEEKHLIENQDDHRTFVTGLANSSKISSSLWKEGNYPYQGYKKPQQEVHGSALNGASFNPYKDWKIIYDSVQNTQNIRSNFPQKDILQSQNQGSSVNDPYNAELFNSAFGNNKRDRNQNTRIIIKQKYNNQDLKNGPTAIPNSHKDNQNTRIETLKTHNSSSNQQVKSNLPYQGHKTVIKNPSHSTSQYQSENIVNNHFQTQQTHRPSRKPIISPGSTQLVEKENGNIHINDDVFKSSSLNKFVNNNVNKSFVTNQESLSKLSYGDGNSRYNSIANINKNNSTLAKENIAIAAIPIAIGNQYNISKSPYTHADLMLKNRDKTVASTNRQNANAYLSSPKLQSFVPIPNHNFSLLHRNQNIRLIADSDNFEKSEFPPSPNLKEVELKNPPKHLEFGDEDFLKPITPIHFHKNSNSNKKLNTFKFSVRDPTGETNKPISVVSKGIERTLLKTSTEIPSSKVDYHESSEREGKKSSEETVDNVYFQPVFPEAPLSNHQAPPTQRFQNYNNNQSPQQISDLSKGYTSKTKSVSDLLEKVILKSDDGSREKPKINKDVIVTKNTDYSLKETKRNNIQGISNDMPKIITPPPVITMKYDPEVSDILNTRDSTNRSDNYVIQRKPALLPESSNKPRKPKITLTTGMLAGILIAALIFLAFLTGSMVYAFHQWKFGRKKSDRQKKKQSRSPRFPPEYLDETFAGNTYIHNNIFLPTPQNLEDRNSTDPDASSITGDEVFHEPTSSSARVRRQPGIYRETREE